MFIIIESMFAKIDSMFINIDVRKKSSRCLQNQYDFCLHTAQRIDLILQHKSMQIFESTKNRGNPCTQTVSRQCALPK